MKLILRLFAITIVVAIIAVIYIVISVLFEYKNQYEQFEVELKNVLAYTELPSYRSGDSIPVFYHSTKKAKATLYHLADKLQEAGFETELPENVQTAMFSPQLGFWWQTDFKMPTKGLKSGYYYLKIAQIDQPDEEFYMPLIIKPDTTPPVAIISSTCTWMAYNRYGGVSCYEDKRSSLLMKTFKFVVLPKYNNIDHQEYLIPFNRPYDCAEELKGHLSSVEYSEPYELLGSHLIRGEWNLSGFLEKHHYDFGVYSDIDFAYEPSILDANVLIFNVHSEYWSPEMVGALERYKAMGKNIIFASGNNVYKKIEFMNGGFVYAYDHYPVEIINEVSGACWNSAGFNTAAPYEVLEPDHWVFNGTGLGKGETFGDCCGISGWETDKVGVGSGNYEVIARGLNKWGPATMIIKEDEQGMIFNAASINFTKGLQLDKTVDRIFHNLLNHCGAYPGISADSTLAETKVN